MKTKIAKMVMRIVGIVLILFDLYLFICFMTENGISSLSGPLFIKLFVMILFYGIPLAIAIVLLYFGFRKPKA